MEPLRLTNTASVTNDQMRKAAARMQGSYAAQAAAPPVQPTVNPAQAAPVGGTATTQPAGAATKASLKMPALSKLATGTNLMRGAGLVGAGMGAYDMLQNGPNLGNATATAIGATTAANPVAGLALGSGVAGGQMLMPDSWAIKLAQLFGSDTSGMTGGGAQIGPETQKMLEAAKVATAGEYNAKRLAAGNDPAKLAELQGGINTPPAADPNQPGKINVSRQANGNLSFSGSGNVQGYAGAGQLKGGSLNVVPAAALQTISPESSAALMAARAAAAQRGDYQSAIDSITSQQGGFKQDITDIANARKKPVGKNFTENLKLRQADQQDELNQSRMAEAASTVGLNAERLKGETLSNKSKKAAADLVDQYLNSGDEKTAAEALTKLNAISGNKEDKYVPFDIEAGKDALGNPVYKKSLFNTRTGQPVDPRLTTGGGEAAPAARQIGDVSTVGNKSAMWDGKQWVPQQ